MIKNILILIFFCNVVYSQNNDPDSVQISKYLKEVVITGQLSSTNKKNAVHDITIIDSKTIRNGAFTNLSDILKYQNNIRISSDNILGSQINIQGITGENIKVLIDGVPVIGRLNGNIDISQINLNNVERIELVEGPLSVNYGSDALGGTINIITKKTKEARQFFDSYYETVGKYNNSVLLNHKYKNQSVSNIFSRNYFSGWSQHDDFSLLPREELADTNRFKPWKPKEQFSNKIEHYIKLNNTSIRSYHEYFYEKITNRGLPQSSTSFATAFDDYYYTFRNNLGCEINTIKNNSQINSIFAYNSYKRIKNTFLKDLTNLTQIILNDPAAQDTSCFNMIMWKTSVTNKKKKKINYQLGIDIQEQYAKGIRIMNGDQKQKDYAVFSNIEWTATENIVFRPGVRVIYNDKYTAPIIPAANLLYKKKYIQVRLSYAKGFRAPSLKELFFEFIDINHNIIGNSNLDAETSDNYRFSINTEKIFKNIKFNSKVSAFYNEINNKIALSNVNTLYSYFNIEKYKTQGLSLNVNISNQDLIVDHSISYIGKYNKLANKTDLPLFNYTLEYSNKISIAVYEKTRLNFFYKYNSESPSFTENNNEIIETLTDRYQLLDLSINNKISEKILLTIGCKNIFNVTDINTSIQNTTHSSNNGSLPIGYGRTFFTNLNIQL